MQKKLGVLEKIEDLRTIWNHEAQDFTPWLGEHISDLGNTLGMDLELRQREADVGAFSLDLLVHDVENDCPVIIENQLESTNHDHLGKLLTYAAGHDASTIVWLAKDFREEHRQALDWLNQRTDSSTQFFGVVVELLRIDNSLPAPNFRLVASPNEWRKTAKSPANSLSERSEAYKAFFQTLIDQLRQIHHFTSARKAQPKSWSRFSSGISGIVYACSFARGNFVRVELYIDRDDRDWNKRLYDELFKQKETIESKLNEEFMWERLDESRASRISAIRPASINESDETLEEIREWMVQGLLKFKDVFDPKLKELVK